MTQDPEDTFPDDPIEGAVGGPSGEGGPKLDEDAAWRSIVDHYGDRPDLSDLPAPEPDERPDEKPRFTVFDRRWEPEPPSPDASSTDALNTEASWDDEGHFIPPTPPPIPKLEPRRKLAWIGLFGSPFLLLLAVVFGWSYPGWVAFFLVMGFIGGFGYLVATMPRRPGEDGSGDNGAVV